jgi:hypothetical protein
MKPIKIFAFSAAHLYRTPPPLVQGRFRQSTGIYLLHAPLDGVICTNVAYFMGRISNGTLAFRKKLTILLEYLVLELSNNLAENSMRRVAIGRKNCVHLGSKQAGAKVAAIFSIVESCRRLTHFRK